MAVQVPVMGSCGVTYYNPGWFVLTELNCQRSRSLSENVADQSKRLHRVCVCTNLCPIFTHPLNRNAMHMYRTDLAGISELNHYALSSAWQQFNDSTTTGSKGHITMQRCWLSWNMCAGNQQCWNIVACKRRVTKALKTNIAISVHC